MNLIARTPTLVLLGSQLHLTPHKFYLRSWVRKKKKVWRMKGDVEVIYHNKLRGLTSQISCRWTKDVLNYEPIFSQFNSSWLPTQISWLHYDLAYHFIGMKLWCHSDIFQGDIILRTIPKRQYWYYTDFCLHYTSVLPVVFGTFDLLEEDKTPSSVTIFIL